MSELSGSEINRFLEVVIGNTEPIGDTWADHRRLERLRVLIDVANWCIDGVSRSAQCAGYEYSVVENRETVRGALLEWKGWIEEVMKEEGGV